MLNMVAVSGRIVKEPELRATGSGKSVASFSIACQRDYKGRDGERETDFFNCIAWGSTAEFVSKYFSKGRMAVVDGRLQQRNWEDKDGNKRTSVEIVAESVYFGDSRKEDGSAGDGDRPAAQKRPETPPASVRQEEFGGFEETDDDGELPF